MRPNFNLKITFFNTYRSREQCTGPTEKMPNADIWCFQCNPYIHLVFVWFGVRVNAPGVFGFFFFLPMLNALFMGYEQCI